MECIICFDRSHSTKQRCACAESRYCDDCFVQLGGMYFDNDFKVHCPVCRSPTTVPSYLHTRVDILQFASRLVATNDLTTMHNLLDRYPRYATMKCSCGCNKTLKDVATAGLYVNPELSDMINLLATKSSPVFG